MQLSKGVEYAFHTLFYMIDMPAGSNIGIKELAELNKLPETYLSKVFTKLRKAGIVRAVPGAKGGYDLAKKAKDISFWDIIEAVEGPAYSFQCAEIRRNNILSDAQDTHNCEKPCLIKVVMEEAEEQMRQYLREKNLEWLKNQVYQEFSEEKKQAIREWVEESAKKV